MSEVTAIAQLEKKRSSWIFRGNASAIALSGAIRALGGFVGVYLPLYFVQIGGETTMLGLFTFAASLTQLLPLPIGGIIADGYGRQKVIVSMAFVGVSFPFSYAFAQDWRVWSLNCIRRCWSCFQPCNQSSNRGLYPTGEADHRNYRYSSHLNASRAQVYLGYYSVAY